MTDFPRCDNCGHEYHGLPCRRYDTTTPGRAGEPCECPSAWKDNS